MTRSTSLPLFVGMATALFLGAAATSASPARASTTIEQLGTDIDGEGSGDQAGWSVALSDDGSTLAVGSPTNDGGASDAGHVRVFTWDGTNWAQRGFDIDGEAAGDHFGYSVSLSGDGTTVAVGARLNDGTGDRAGHVRIHDWNGTNWVQRGADIDGEEIDDQSGWAVALSGDGNVVVIGAPLNGGFNSGHARVFAWTSGAWTQRGADIDGEGDFDSLGWSVAIDEDGTTIAMGAVFNDGAGNEAGHARIFDWSNGSWIQRGNDIDGEAAGDVAGYDVALSADGNTVVVGANGNDGSANDAGHVRIFDWSNGSWIQRGNDIDGEAADDQSGVSVDVSNDGNAVVIGAPYNAGGGYNAGHARVYRWTSGAWAQSGNDIDGESFGDISGFSVTISGNGTTIAVGAPFAKRNGPTTGHARVFGQATPVVPSDPPLERIAAPTPAPVHRATLDPNGGTCIDDDTSHSSTWTSVFVGYHYLPNATDCARAGFTLTGWANRTTPTTSAALPLLVDPSDGQRRPFLATDADLVAIWTPTLDNLTVFANFLCGPCTSIWVIHTTTPPEVTVDIAVDDAPLTCNQRGDAFGVTFCEITSLTPGEHTVTATPLHRSDGRDTVGRPTSIAVALRA